jgi:hypothetical protein
MDNPLKNSEIGETMAGRETNKMECTGGKIRKHKPSSPKINYRALTAMNAGSRKTRFL